MIARRARWELCHAKGVGYWVRFISSNGNIIVTSETYGRKRDALNAVDLVDAQCPIGWRHEIRDLTGRKP